MSTLYLQINSAEKQTVSALGIQSMNLDWFNTAPSTLEISLSPNRINTTPRFHYADTVKLFEDEICRFIGTVTRTPKNALRGKIETQTATVSDILHALDQDQYQQQWRTSATAASYTGRVQLSRDISNNHITIGAALKLVLDHAVASGISLAYVQADLDALTTIPPDDERLDITWLEAIRSLLYWTPETALEVQYTTETPTLRFIKRSAATPLDIPSEKLKTLTVQPRNDLQLRGCLINFESTNLDNGVQYVSTTEQSAGETTGARILKQTIQLAGYNATESYQTAEIETDDPDYTNIAWWKRYIPGLSLISGITLSSGTSPIELLDYPRVLTKGPLPEWTGKTAVEVEFTATISGTYNGTAITDQPIAVRVWLTDAYTTTYKRIMSWSYRPAEAAPSGLANAIYSERAALHYQGTAQSTPVHLRDLAESSVFSVTPAKTINLTAPEGNLWDDTGNWSDAENFSDGTNGITGLAAINAVIERIRITFALNTAERTISFGPPRHLGLDDYINIARGSRTIRELTWNRNGTDTNDNEAIAASGQTPNTNGNIPNVTSGLPSGEAGDILFHDGEQWQKLVIGTDTQILTAAASDGTTLPIWADAPSSSLPAGAIGQILVHNGTTWAALENPSADALMFYDAITNGINHLLNATGEEKLVLFNASGELELSATPLDTTAIMLQNTNGSLSWLQNKSGNPAMIIYTAAGDPTITQLGSTPELIYHNGSGAISTLPLSSGSAYELIQLSAAGTTLEIDEMRAT